MTRIFIFLFFYLLSPLTMALSYTVEVTEAELQKKVMAMMPIQKKKLFFTITLFDPKIELIKGSNEVGIFTHIDIDSDIGIKGTGRAKIAGALSYDAETSAFFFKNSKIQQLEIDAISPKYIPKIKKWVGKISQKFLAKRPVYKLKDDNLKHKLAKSVLESVTVIDKKLLLKLSVF